MAKALLPFASFSGPDPEFSLDAEGLARLEAAYGITIPELARGRLKAIGDSYLADRRIEMVWQSYRDVEALLPPFKKAAAAIWNIAYERTSHTDAGSELEAIIERSLAGQPLRIQPERGDLRLLTSEGWSDFSDAYQLPDGAYAVRFDLAFVREFAMNLTVALTIAGKEIAQLANEQPERTRQGSTGRLILALTEWAKIFGFVHAAYIDGSEPAPFARLACAFLSLVPSDFQESRELSDGALAMQIKRVRNAETKYQRGQMQKKIETNLPP